MTWPQTNLRCKRDVLCYKVLQSIKCVITIVYWLEKCISHYNFLPNPILGMYSTASYNFGNLPRTFGARCTSCISNSQVYSFPGMNSTLNYQYFGHNGCLNMLFHMYISGTMLRCAGGISLYMLLPLGKLRQYVTRCIILQVTLLEAGIE